MNSKYKYILDNIRHINDSVTNFALKYNRNKKEIDVLIASKNRSELEIMSLIESGYRLFGENKVLEAKEKWTKIKKQYTDIKLHLIGHLQTNKVKQAIEIFDVIETLDSYKLAEMLIKKRDDGFKIPEVLIQVNVGEEERKYGVMPQVVDEFIDNIINDFKIPVKGLMCIPPNDQQASLYFSLLKNIAQSHNLSYLSMGMSQDFEKAIACGTNEIRIGTAIFAKNEG